MPFSYDVARGKPREDEALEKRVARQAVGAVHAVAACLARRVEMRQGGLGVCAHVDATHEVVLRGHHGDWLAADVVALLQAALPDVEWMET